MHSNIRRIQITSRREKKYQQGAKEFSVLVNKCGNVGTSRKRFRRSAARHRAADAVVVRCRVPDASGQVKNCEAALAEG